MQSVPIQPSHGHFPYQLVFQKFEYLDTGQKDKQQLLETQQPDLIPSIALLFLINFLGFDHNLNQDHNTLFHPTP